MKFVLEVDMTGFGENAEKELGRILRYWGGNLNHYPLQSGDHADISDSDYKVVGQWRITEDGE